MLKQMTSADFLACIPHVVEPHWDNVWAPRLAGFPINIVYAARAEGVGLALATYVFDPDTFSQDGRSRQMRYRPTIASDFSVVVVLHPEGRIETFQISRISGDLRSEGPRFPHGYDSHFGWGPWNQEI
jgi:hypothetical protein